MTRVRPTRETKRILMSISAPPGQTLHATFRIPFNNNVVVNDFVSRNNVVVGVTRNSHLFHSHHRRITGRIIIDTVFHSRDQGGPRETGGPRNIFGSPSHLN